MLVHLYAVVLRRSASVVLVCVLATIAMSSHTSWHEIMSVEQQMATVGGNPPCGHCGSPTLGVGCNKPDKLCAIGNGACVGNGSAGQFCYSKVKYENPPQPIGDISDGSCAGTRAALDVVCYNKHRCECAYQNNMWVCVDIGVEPDPDPNDACEGTKCVGKCYAYACLGCPADGPGPIGPIGPIGPGPGGTGP